MTEDQVISLITSVYKELEERRMVAIKSFIKAEVMETILDVLRAHDLIPPNTEDE